MSMIATRASWGGPSLIGTFYPSAMLAVTAHNTYIPTLPASATVAQERAAMLSMHRGHIRDNKWAGIGYHLVIFQSGRCYEARGWQRVGAHAGSNAGNRTLGVAFVINGETTEPSPAALATFQAIRDLGVQLGHLTRGHALKFHWDWKATRCPGKKIVDALTRQAAPSPRVAGVVLKPGERSENVRAWQELMVRFGYMTQTEMNTGPGINGPRTQRATATFLAAHAD